MATTIRVSDRTRQALERVRAKLTLESGRRLSLEETMEILLQDEVVERGLKLGGGGDRGAEGEWEKLFSLQRDWGTSVPPEDYDDIATEDQR